MRCGACAGLVRTFQVTRLFSDMTPEEHVALAVLQREGGRPACSAASLAMLEWSPTRSMDARHARPAPRSRRRKVGEIAYGQQRLLEIAVALALKPKVLLLDEPAAGVPAERYARIEQALERLPPTSPC